MNQGFQTSVHLVAENKIRGLYERIKKFLFIYSKIKLDHAIP